MKPEMQKVMIFFPVSESMRDPVIDQKYSSGESVVHAAVQHISGVSAENIKDLPFGVGTEKKIPDIIRACCRRMLRNDFADSITKIYLL